MSFHYSLLYKSILIISNKESQERHIFHFFRNKYLQLGVSGENVIVVSLHDLYKQLHPISSVTARITLVFMYRKYGRWTKKYRNFR
jgi:hypothetical protein